MGTVEQLRYRGPYEIHSYCNKGNYKLKDLQSGKTVGPYNQTSLKKFYDGNDIRTVTVSDNESGDDDKKCENESEEETVPLKTNDDIEIYEKGEIPCAQSKVSDEKELNNDNSDPITLFDLPMSPFEVNEITESETECVLSTPKPKRTKKTKNSSIYEYY